MTPSPPREPGSSPKAPCAQDRAGAVDAVPACKAPFLLQRWYRLPIIAALAAQTLAGTASAKETSAPPLLCLGTEPRFLLAIRPDDGDGAEATFDYLGDGTFAFDPPPVPWLTFSSHRLTTAGGPIDTYLEGRACRAMGMSFPVTVQMAVPAGDGLTTFVGCCLWQDG